MISEADVKTKAVKAESRARGFDDLPALHEHFERTTSKLDPHEKREFAIWMRVTADVLTKQGRGAKGQGEQTEAVRVEADEQTRWGIPAYILRMLERLPDDSLVATYALIMMGSKADVVWNKIIAWLYEKTGPFRQGDFQGKDIELEADIREWLSFETALDICDDN